MITVVCVLKCGQFMNRNNKVEYSPDHVRWLKRMVAAHTTLEHRFVCLSDVRIEGVDTIPLTQGWPGWWSKMELFKHRYNGRVFYIDLDTVIVGNIDKILGYRHKFTVLQNLSKRDRTIGSGLMAWSGDQTYLYDQFVAAPDKHMDEYTTARRWGDQGFIQDHCKKWEYFQTLFPGQIQSYKFDLKHGDPPPECNIVCFHGKPKPWEVEKSWISK